MEALVGLPTNNILHSGHDLGLEQPFSGVISGWMRSVALLHLARHNHHLRSGVYLVSQTQFSISKLQQIDFCHKPIDPFIFLLNIEKR